jgi:hypothetical protein
MHNVNNGHRLPIPRHCPPVLMTLLHDCWQTDPDQRPTMRDVTRRLGDYLRTLAPITTASKPLLTSPASSGTPLQISASAFTPNVIAAALANGDTITTAHDSTYSAYAYATLSPNTSSASFRSDSNTSIATPSTPHPTPSTSGVSLAGTPLASSIPSSTLPIIPQLSHGSGSGGPLTVLPSSMTVGAGARPSNVVGGAGTLAAAIYTGALETIKKDAATLSSSSSSSVMPELPDRQDVASSGAYINLPPTPTILATDTTAAPGSHF